MSFKTKHFIEEDGHPATCQASPSFTISWSMLKLMSTELVMPSNHLILCHPLLLLPSILPSIRIFFIFVTPWTVVHQAPLSMGFSRQKYWSELPCPPPGYLPDPGTEPSSLTSPVLAGRFFTTSTTWEALRCVHVTTNVCTTVYLKGNENLTLIF